MQIIKAVYGRKKKLLGIHHSVKNCVDKYFQQFNVS